MEKKNDMNIKFDKEVHSSLPKIATNSDSQERNHPERKALKRRTKEIWSDYGVAELPSMMSKENRKARIIEGRPEKPQMEYEKKDNISRPSQKRLYKFKRALSISLVAMFAFMSVYCATKVSLCKSDDQSTDVQISNIQNLVVPKIVNDDSPVVQPDETSTKPTNLISLREYDLSKLIEMNPDTVGYIKIGGLDVDAPFVQTFDNEYYLDHSFDRSTNVAGWIFGDYRNDWDNLKKNTIIYGHNRSNYKMFGSLKLVFEKSWLENEDNHIIYISTGKANLAFEIFSAYTIPTETYYLRNTFKTDAEYADFLETIATRSQVDFGVEVSSEDKVLTLSTCHTNTSKTVIHAKLVSMQNK